MNVNILQPHVCPKAAFEARDQFWSVISNCSVATIRMPKLCGHRSLWNGHRMLVTDGHKNTESGRSLISKNFGFLAKDTLGPLASSRVSRAKTLKLASSHYESHFITQLCHLRCRNCTIVI